MADDYGTCPNDVYEDERLTGAPFCTIAAAVLLMNLADDHGRLDGDPRVIARRVGCSHDEIEDVLVKLESRHFIERYEAAGRGGAPKLVIQILDFHSYKGHPHRVAQPSKRGASSYPTKQGETVPSRRAREKRGADVAQPWNDRGAGVAQSGQVCGADVAELVPERGAGVASRAGAQPAPCARDQHSTAQHSTEGALTGLPNVHAASARAPTCAPLGGRADAHEGPVNCNTAAPHPQPPPGVSVLRAPHVGADGKPITPHFGADAPDRPPDEGESWESFAARYPWPAYADVAVDPWARIALNARARETGVKPLVLREALTRERHGGNGQVPGENTAAEAR